MDGVKVRSGGDSVFIELVLAKVVAARSVRKKTINELSGVMCDNAKGMRRVENFSNRFPSDVPHFQSRLIGSAVFTVLCNSPVSIKSCAPQCARFKATTDG